VFSPVFFYDQISTILEMFHHLIVLRLLLYSITDILVKQIKYKNDSQVLISNIKKEKRKKESF